MPLPKNEQEAREQTRTAWGLFKRFSNEELDKLLGLRGVVPMKDRAFKIHQSLIIWFGGDIPHLDELCKLAEAYHEQMTRTGRSEG
jgi:hypothetical protein